MQGAEGLSQTHRPWEVGKGALDGLDSVSGLTEHLMNAFSLSERASHLREARKGWVASKTDAEHAAFVLHHWKSQEPFTSVDSLFQERLRLDGLTEEDLLTIFGLPPEVYSELIRSAPDWARELEWLYLHPRRSRENAEFLRYVEEAKSGFLWVAYPVLQEGLRRFRAGMRGLPKEGVPFDKVNVWRLAAPHLLNLLERALDPVMVLELNVARVQGKLKGRTPEERFQSFCDRLRRRDVRRAIVREYPVLFRSLYIATLNWVDSSLELLDRLSRDWHLITHSFAAGASLGNLTSIASGLGDTHRCGRSVAVLGFSAGFRLVYKPRGHSVDVHFAELLDSVNQAGFATSFRILTIIDRGSYGWSEFVTQLPCSTRDEVERFYHRLGGYLALFHITKAKDMHFDNLLASGEYPVPVDIETLFHGDATEPDFDPAMKAFRQSVMQVLLLPQRMFDSATDEGIDLSAFGAEGGQHFPASSSSSWERAATDRMRLVRGKTKQVLIARNRPKLEGQDVVPGEYIESFIAGFQWIYRLVEKRRDELQATGGLLARFGDDEVRFVARPTATYGASLRICQHPDQLRSALDRDEALNGLWLGVTKYTHLIRLIPAELIDLQNGDIPVFTTRPNSCDLWSSTGERIPDVFAQPAMAVVQDGLSRLGEEDLQQQVKFIRSAIESSGKGSRPGSSVSAPRKPLLFHPSQAIELACAVGNLLCRNTLENEAYASWIGITPVGTSERSTSLRPLDLGLYNGLPGCSLFLAHLGAITGEQSYQRIARKALSLIETYLDHGRDRGVALQKLGAFSGLGGIIYTLSHLGVLWNDASLIERAKALAADVPALVEADNALDVIGGSAGAIGALQVLNGVSPSDHLLNAAVACGEHLLSLQHPQRNGAAWTTEAASSQPLTGFSHGAAGIAWALIKLSAWSGDARFRESAQSAIAYERSTFVEREANWPDYRPPSEEDRLDSRFMVAWCHGAPGIGLARMDNLRYVDDAATREEVGTALRKTIDSGFGLGPHYCLCHGDLGNLDILVHAAQRVDESWWNDNGNRLASVTLTAIAKRGYLHNLVAPPGLMMGLAGIGYGLLRLACPEQVPCALVLAPPAGA
jgi:type 2 lantibiotic biosynthesis protein LanM